MKSEIGGMNIVKNSNKYLQKNSTQIVHSI